MSIFTDVFIKKPGKSKQVLDHPVFTTTDFGKLIPILVEDVLPGDVFKCKTAAEIKLFPTLAPMKQGIEVRIDYFFVPNRLCWDKWQDFITGGEDGTAAPIKPYIVAHDQHTDIGSLWDYMGLPADIPAGSRGNQSTLNPLVSNKVDAIPFRAYQLIWNEYYRDENLDNPISGDTSSGEDTYPYDLLYRSLKKDYFTSALPWTQRGPSVTIPLSGNAPVTGVTVQESKLTEFSDQFKASEGSLSQPGYDLKLERDPNHPSVGYIYGQSGSEIHYLSHQHRVNIPTLDVEGEADLSHASAVSINEFRRLNSVQKWLERNARAGSRYVEQILSHFGVRTPDFRLDRPEYLGGNKQILGMAEVLQTSSTDQTSPQGARAGVGFGNMLAKSKKYFVQEHGWIFGLMSIIPAQNIYADGFQRKYSRMDKFDYYFPEFQHLGEQAILNKEVYGYYSTKPNDEFGYTPRYAEYRYHPGVVTGQMRSSMSYWHMARLFNSLPTLSADFIDSHPSGEYDRMFPTDESLGDRFVVYMHHFERMKRPMKRNPNPSL